MLCKEIIMDKLFACSFHSAVVAFHCDDLESPLVTVLAFAIFFAAVGA
jgi:hypothetical protein